MDAPCSEQGSNVSDVRVIGRREFPTDQNRIASADVFVDHIPQFVGKLLLHNLAEVSACQLAIGSDIIFDDLTGVTGISLALSM
jgi:hypothetical protein